MFDFNDYLCLSAILAENETKFNSLAYFLLNFITNRKKRVLSTMPTGPDAAHNMGELRGSTINRYRYWAWLGGDGEVAEKIEALVTDLLGTETFEILVVEPQS